MKIIAFILLIITSFTTKSQDKLIFFENNYTDTLWLPDFITNVGTWDYRDSLVYDEKKFHSYIDSVKKSAIDSFNSINIEPQKANSKINFYTNGKFKPQENIMPYAGSSILTVDDGAL